MITLYVNHGGNNYRISRSSKKGMYKGKLRIMIQCKGTGFVNLRWLSLEEEFENDHKMQELFAKAYKQTEKILKGLI